MKNFIIKRGRHKASGLNFGFTFKNEVKYRCSLDKSCLYEFNDVDDYDINKLCGFSTTWHHHNQSARFGWRCVDNSQFEILSYSYIDGERKINETEVFGTVLPNEEFEISIKDSGTAYIYSFKKDNKKRPVNFIHKKKKKWFLFNYFLYPYFGGNKTAPHDMLIKIKRF